MGDTDFPYFQLSMSPRRRLVESLRFKEVLDVIRSGNRKPRFPGILSPLSDTQRLVRGQEALRLIGIAFLLLAAYIAVQPIYVLVAQSHPRHSLLGICLAGAHRRRLVWPRAVSAALVDRTLTLLPRSPGAGAHARSVKYRAISVPCEPAAEPTSRRSMTRFRPRTLARSRAMSAA
jgi:hypothetical protein